MIYMVAQLPLGTLYFTSVRRHALARARGDRDAGSPLRFRVSPYTSPRIRVFYLPDWMAPLFVVVGMMWFLVTLHLARALGRLHGRFAKTMLVR